KIPTTAFVGTPTTPPSGAVRQSGGKVTVYASWNGATQVASWRGLAGSSPDSLSAVTTTAKSGFETTIPVSGSYQVFKVQALDASGMVLGTSKVLRPRT